MNYLEDRPHPEELDRDALADALHQAAGDEARQWKRPSLRSDAREHRCKLTWHRVKLILEKLEKGMSKTSAAEAAGLSAKSLIRWQRQGREALERIEEGADVDAEAWIRACFFVQLMRAWSAGEERLYDVVDEAAVEDGQWKPALELLKRTRKERYAQHRSVERTERVEGNVTIELDTPDRPDPGRVSEDRVRELARNMDDDGMLADDDRRLLEARGIELDAEADEDD